MFLRLCFYNRNDTLIGWLRVGVKLYASLSIPANVNQTIILSLAAVVVASLIGAKGLGEDVLETLQYVNVGQGILAGFAFCFVQ